MRFSSTRRMLMAAGSALALTIAFSGTYAFAGSSTGNLSVSATVASTCTISQTSALTFTGYDRADANPNDGTGSMTIACTNGGSPASVSFSTGANSGSSCDTASGGADANNRCLKTGSNYLAYNVYSDSARTTLFGLTGTSTTAETSTGAFTIYGRIPAGQAVPTGSYSDTLVATVNY
ncbi:MAG TPA: spore coat U domain-containing protein [Candidatus Rubrimentiphilum sp.]|nr:spore coat U domain-containing protein [Candidatus Rubrimentiphilum sp.]